MLWALPLCAVECVCVCVSLLLTCGASVRKHNLTATKGKGEKKRKKEKKEPRRRRENFWGTPSLTHSIWPSSSKCPFPFLLTLSFRFALLSKHIFSLCIFLSLPFFSKFVSMISWGGVYWEQKSDNSTLYRTKERIERGRDEAHPHRFLCDPPHHRHPLRAPQTADCSAVTNTHRCIYIINVNINVKNKREQEKNRHDNNLLYSHLCCNLQDLPSQPSHVDQKLLSHRLQLQINKISSNVNNWPLVLSFWITAILWG